MKWNAGNISCVSFISCLGLQTACGCVPMSERVFSGFKWDSSDSLVCLLKGLTDLPVRLLTWWWQIQTVKYLAHTGFVASSLLTAAMKEWRTSLSHQGLDQRLTRLYWTVLYAVVLQCTFLQQRFSFSCNQHSSAHVSSHSIYWPLCVLTPQSQRPFNILPWWFEASATQSR